MTEMNSWYEWFARDDADKLTRLLEAIRKWSTMVHEAFDARLDEVERDGTIPQELYDNFGDEAFMIQDTERTLYGSFAVAVATATETFVGNICASLSLPYVDGKGKPVKRPDWGDKKRALEKVIGVLDGLQGFSGNQRARILGNCFKHYNGRANRDCAKTFGMNEGAVIQYEKEAWDQSITDTQSFLSAIAQKALKDSP